MELISKEEAIKTIKRLDDSCSMSFIENLIMDLHAVDLVFCKDCVHVTRRENLKEPMKSRLPKELIGECWRTKLYVHADDYCCGGEEL